MVDGDRQTAEVLHADAFEALGELEDDSAHAAVVDYPWQFEIQNGTGRMEYRRKPGQGDGVGDRNLTREDAMFGMEGDERVPELLNELARVLVDGAWLLCLADDRFQEPTREAIRESEFTLRRNWAWTPESMGMGYYGRVDHYPVPAATLGDTERYVQDRSTLFRIPGGRQTEYPTGKPVELYRQMLRPPVIEDGERLLEPFCGSGPGAAVANERGLNYWGCDVDVDAVEGTRERLQEPKLHGQTTLTDGGC